MSATFAAAVLAAFDTRSERCKRPGLVAASTNATRSCGSRSLLSRSYLMRKRWPYDALHIIMEFNPGTCDLYQESEAQPFCCLVTGEFHEPERAVSEAIASFLVGCSRRQIGQECLALDLGANNGWFSLMMLQLGAHVISVEPQPDLSRALKESVELNCWSHRSIVLNAYMCTSRESYRANGKYDRCMRRVTNASTCNVGGWRHGGSYSQISREYGNRCAETFGLPKVVRGMGLGGIILHAARADSVRGIAFGPELERAARDAVRAQAGSPPPIINPLPIIDLIKMDVDGPEGAWMWEIDDLLTRRVLLVRTIVVEASYVKPGQMARFQNVHGYTCYRLDAHDSRRSITREGWDGFSPPGTIARLDRYGSEHRAAEVFLSQYSPHNPRAPGAVGPKPAQDGVSRRELEEELFAVRAMRHVFRAKPGLSEAHWATLMNPLQHDKTASAPLQWVLTQEGDLTEPTNPGADWRRVSPEYAHAKTSGHVPADLDKAYDALAGPKPNSSVVPPAVTSARTSTRTTFHFTTPRQSSFTPFQQQLRTSTARTST